jgi:diphosphomevalonate decarboxylase
VIHKRIQQARHQGLPVFFSIDAGPNVNLLYPDYRSKDVEKFIREELTQFCEKGQVIFDQSGDGPQLIKTEQHRNP